MAEPIKRPLQLAEALEFRPRWWWDPVPPWLFEHLTPQVIRDVALIQLEFNKTVLEAQFKAAERVLSAVQKGK